jgi:ATP-dependent DNA helicase RecG
MMSATPIPRTLAMSYYADLDVSVIDEMPPGRTPVATRLVSDARRGEVIQRVRNACVEGSQAYWVCPLIEDYDAGARSPGTGDREGGATARSGTPTLPTRSRGRLEALQLQTALDTYQRVAATFPELKVGLVHGRLAGSEKTAAMQSFQSGSIQLLVATTVIEVGVDVPNATIMIVQEADRFGLAQLHQLRGRVGRGGEQSYCLLVSRPKEELTEEAAHRLEALVATSDGFELAEVDLELRGEGQLLGVRQSGYSDLKFARMLPMTSPAR